ncbi:MAG: PP2C family protein-serine/threonine phosphatase [Phycisphaerales bacterium]
MDRAALQNVTLHRLLEVSRQLGVSDNLPDILNLIIDAMRDLLASERATVFEYDAERDELYSSVAHEAKTIRFSARSGIAGTAATERRIINIADAYKNPAFNRDIDRATGFRTRSMLTIPLISPDDELIGVAQVLNKRDGTSFDDDDLAIAEALASQAAVAIKRAHLVEDQLARQRMERDLELARVIQRATWPQQIPTLHGLDIATFSESADSTGGDTHDLITLDNGDVLAMLADATGHGIGPALVATSLRAMLRMGVSMNASLAELATQLNRQLCKDLPLGHFITVWLAVLHADTNTLESYSAGQAPLLHYHAARGRVTQLQSDDVPFGVIPDATPEEPVSIPLQPGDTFIVLSDGFFEAMNERRERIGTEEIITTITQNCRSSASDLIAAIRQTVDNFANGTPASDDQTALVIRRLPLPKGGTQP